MLHFFRRKRIRRDLWLYAELLWRMGQQLEGTILSANSDAIEVIVGQLGKAKDEIVGKIAALQAAVDAGQDLSGPLADLQNAAQALDDVVPDAPVVEPTV